MTTPWSFTRWTVLFIRLVRPIAAWTRTCLVFAFVDLYAAQAKMMILKSILHTLALAYPSFIVIFRTSSFLKRTVCTPDIALTTVDLPWATCPIVPVWSASALTVSGQRSIPHLNLLSPAHLSKRTHIYHPAGLPVLR